MAVARASNTSTRQDWREITGQAGRNRLPGTPPVAVDDDIARVAGPLLAEANDRAGGDTGLGANGSSIPAMTDILDDVGLRDNMDAFTTLGISVET